MATTTGSGSSRTRRATRRKFRGRTATATRETSSSGETCSSVHGTARRRPGGSATGQPVPGGLRGHACLRHQQHRGSEARRRGRAERAAAGRLSGLRHAHAHARPGSRATTASSIYNATSGGNTLLPPADQDCDWIDIVQVPLANPAAASHVRREPLEGGHAAHDNGVILGDVNMLATASGHMSNMFDIGDNAHPGRQPGGPAVALHDRGAGRLIRRPAVTATGTPPASRWDGEVIILGWEPGGGALPECEATDPPVKKSAFFYDAEPVRSSVSGHCRVRSPRLRTAPSTTTTLCRCATAGTCSSAATTRPGTWVTDFTDPASPVTLGWSDPPPLPQVTSPRASSSTSSAARGHLTGTTISSMSRRSPKGLNVFRFSGPETGGAIRLPHLNPQTQEFSIG